MKLIKILFALTIILLSVGLSLLNPDIISFNYILGAVELPVSVLMLSAFALGLLVGCIMLLIAIGRVKLQLSKSQKALKLAKQELEKLRIMPIKSP